MLFPITVNLTEREHEAVTELSRKLDLPADRVLIQALRLMSPFTPEAKPDPNAVDWDIPADLVLTRQTVIDVLKDLHREYGIDVMFTARQVAKAVGCKPLDLFDRDSDTGILYELWQEGTVRGDLDDSWALMGNWEWSE